ncbi:bud emergence protein 1 [Geranomyces variabilis]|uniref:Bud emergence protein 1 n=1 Tax=Geranomyces variabilis TaxID=109894 RepID=A0AAD5TIM0_9FUNG|nr:bud emergence protein 1 [Geranomyces variabilis]
MLANLFGTSNAVSSSTSTGNGRTPPVNKQRSDNHHRSQPANGTQYARGGTAARSVTAPMRGSSQSTEIFKQPPIKVIRATRDYKAQFVNELEFARGDFFYVITDLDDFYYEAMNPIARVRGLVPRSHFESLDKVAAGTQQQQQQQPPAPGPAAAKAPAPESPLEYLQNQLNIRQQQQQREPPSRDRDRDRDNHQRGYDSVGARGSERDAASNYRGNDNSSSSHMSVSAMTASTTTNYDDYKHHSSYTHGYAESNASSETHSSAYSTVHSTDYPVSRSPVPVRPLRENREQQQQQQPQPRREREPERPSPRAIPMPAGRRKQSIDEKDEKESEIADRRHRHPEHRGEDPARQRHHTHNGQHYQHQQQQLPARAATVTKPAYSSTPRVAPPSASLLSKSAPSSQHQPHRYPTTTTSTTSAAKPISGMGGRLPHPVSARVQADTMLPDGRFQYTIELHLSDDTSRVLLRVFDDFYTLHVSLLSQFAAQSGRLRDQPRSIPFLPPAPVTPKPFNNAAQAAAPPAQVTPAEQARRRRALDAYLTDLVALPAPIRHSPPLNRFFMQRKGDNTLATAVRFDTSAALMDLISDYNSYPSMSRNGGKTPANGTKSLTALPTTPSTSLDLLDDHFVRIKLHLPAGDETLAWRIDESMPFMDFVDEVAAKTRWRMRDGWAMWYKDEVGGLVKLTGESDWRLVVRGRWEKVVLYID